MASDISFVGYIDIAVLFVHIRWKLLDNIK